jgi:hypothetical protein
VITSKKWPSGSERSRSSWNEGGWRNPLRTIMPSPKPVAPWQSAQ